MASSESILSVQETPVQKYIWREVETFVPPTVDKHGNVLVPIRLVPRLDKWGYLSYEQVLRWLSIKKIDISTVSYIWMDGDDVIHFDLPEYEAEKLLVMKIFETPRCSFDVERERRFDRVPYQDMDQRREWSKSFAIPGLLSKVALPDPKIWLHAAFQNNAASQQQADDEPVYPSATKRPRL